MPKAKLNLLGLFKADKVPKLQSIIVEKPGIEEAYGAIGIGEITSIPLAPLYQEHITDGTASSRRNCTLEERPIEK